MYRVVKAFFDLQDGDHRYEIGDSFPRAGVSVSDKRLAELSGGKNAQREPLIAEVPEPKKVEKKEETKKGQKK